MAAVTVKNYHKTADEAVSLLERIEELEAVIRRKAHELSEQRESWTSWDLDNWLAAEKQVLCVPACELLENSRRYLLRAALPGLKPEQIQVTALPHTLVLEAEQHTSTGKKTDTAMFSEFSQDRMLRRIGLPDEIDVGKVKARLENGILEVAAAKLTATGSKRKTAAARVARSDVSQKRAETERSRAGRKGPRKTKAK